jgi:hypothetical protein
MHRPAAVEVNPTPLLSENSCNPYTKLQWCRLTNPGLVSLRWHTRHATPLASLARYGGSHLQQGPHSLAVPPKRHELDGARQWAGQRHHAVLCGGRARVIDGTEAAHIVAARPIRKGLQGLYTPAPDRVPMSHLQVISHTSSTEGWPGAE